VGFDGVTKLIDFGIAKVQNASVQTAAGVLKGKYAYMSPEHARAQPLDCRADIWSLGVVLYELQSGRRLFAGATVGETVEAILSFDIPTLQTTPPELGQLIAKMLSRDPDARFASHSDVHGALATIADSAPGGPDSTSPEAIAAWMERLFPETPSFESDLTEADVRLVLSAEERGEETTDVQSDVGSATRIFFADATGQAEYRAVLAALLSRGKLEPREEGEALETPGAVEPLAVPVAPPPASVITVRRLAKETRARRSGARPSRFALRPSRR
jgi:serine/threonine protein kinase